MAQKILTCSYCLTAFLASCLLIHLVFESEFVLGIKDVTLPNENVILMIKILMLERFLKSKN